MFVVSHLSCRSVARNCIKRVGGQAETVTCVYWLPCVVAWPVANGYFVWNRVENKVIDGLVSDLSKKHMENFAKR